MFSSLRLHELFPDNPKIGDVMWEEKQPRQEVDTIEQGDKYVFNAQYMQEPTSLGGTMFKPKYFRYYEILPMDINTYRIYGDTAQKTGQHNDYSVFQFWGLSPSKGVFLIDQIRGKWEAPDLERNLVNFWNKNKPRGAQVIKIEDKSSGSSLIQSIRRDNLIPIEGIPRYTDKLMRAMGVIKYFSSGHVHIPTNAEWISDYVDEFEKFSPLLNHAHDDQIDPTMDAVEDLLIKEVSIYSAHAL